MPLTSQLQLDRGRLSLQHLSCCGCQKCFKKGREKTLIVCVLEHILNLKAQFTWIIKITFSHMPLEVSMLRYFGFEICFHPSTVAVNGISFVLLTAQNGI